MVGMCGSLNWELKFNYFPWIELNWLNCWELKVSIQFINIIVGNKIVVKYHKFLFPDLTQFRRRKISICHPKTKDFESKSTAENYGRNRKSKYIHKIVIFQVTILEISRRRALNWFWIELQFMPSNWIGIELNKTSLDRTCLLYGYYRRKL